MSDGYQLDRFVEAQDSIYPDVVAELREGRKRSHWIWFVFPQLKGLGHSWMANRYGIQSRAEAEAYLRHPILGSRLIECADLVCAVSDRRIEQILGRPDDMKFRSSMTLFSIVQTNSFVFEQALNQYFEGRKDDLTLRLLEQMP